MIATSISDLKFQISIVIEDSRVNADVFNLRSGNRIRLIDQFDLAGHNIPGLHKLYARR